MEKGIKVCRIDDCKDLLVKLIRKGALIPVLGSGFSAGQRTPKGIVPNGLQMKQIMINALATLDEHISDSKPFSQVAKYYNQLIPSSERKIYIAENFVNVNLTQERKDFLKINWPCIYTLNIDDAIEKNSNYQAIGPNVELEKVAFDIKPVYKLHGNAKDIVLLKSGEKFSIFDADQYIDSLTNNKWLLNKLKQDYIDKNILFVGCSLDDEIDLMHVFSRVRIKNPIVQTEKFFVTTKDSFSKTELIDLESYGITKVLVVENYVQLYDYFINAGELSRCVEHDELSVCKNIPISRLSNRSPLNRDYILFGKTPLSEKEKKIVLPSFFISRDISKNILEDLSLYPVQIIYGKRVSGKSYLLLDICARLADRDVFYFDSRKKINQVTIQDLLKKKNTVLLFDTHVLTEDAFQYLLGTDLDGLKKNKLNVILCANSSSKQTAIELQKIKENKNAFIYLLDNKLSDVEYEELKRNLISANIPYFQKDLTILDSILWIQDRLSRTKAMSLLNDFYLNPKDYLQLSSIILLVYKEKLTTADLVRYDLLQETAQLLPKLDKAAEADYGKCLYSDFWDSSLFQVVCNAQIWLLGYLSRISLGRTYFNTFTKAFDYIIRKISDTSLDRRKRKKEILDFILFDNMNNLLGGARTKDNPSGARKIIQAVYIGLKDVLGIEYQFNHQYAKCLLWGIENLNESDRIKDLNEALQSAIIAQQQINEYRRQKKNEYLEISFAHVMFTISMIRVKLFFFDKSKESFNAAAVQLYNSLKLPQNAEALELYDNFTEDNYDYSVSKFMDFLLSKESEEYKSGLKKEITFIANYRLKIMKN